MIENTLLNYQYKKVANPEKNPAQTMVLLHGLFGDLHNLGVIARAFSDNYNILQIDLRNHGLSFHSDEMNYNLIAQDLEAVLTSLDINNAIVVGHSMGGKAAMALANFAPSLVDKLIILDMAPVAYKENHHDAVFKGLFAVKEKKPTNRQEAKEAISVGIKMEEVKQFMLKSFDPNAPESFKFNLTGLKNNYDNLMGWQPVLVNKPTLFIKGELSDYLQEKDTQTILTQFPQASFFVISNTGHWLHAEKPDNVIRAMKKFLDKNV
ncbi:alpha/beta fold hydrolase [Otariodibacter sp.]|uniref:alpha/beta fold hydrolase n=1 Tax=Otariodibacter sp. TaxID=3030919 RepID=UPI002628CC3C|nr:alpha/beta fold hydrolase [Otariodibacter sp.]